MAARDENIGLWCIMVFCVGGVLIRIRPSHGILAHASGRIKSNAAEI